MTRWWVAACAVVMTAVGASAQDTHQHGGAPAAAPAARTGGARAAAPPEEVPTLAGGEVPLQCWWRAAKGAIHIGEIVEVTLTCSALESDTTRAVPDETRLNVAAVQLAPWEIVGGSHPADTRAGSRRLFQYIYELRILDPVAIGRDVKLPPLTVPYRIQSRMGADAAISGRDLTHVMPQIPIRVVGQVPGEAYDIRDGSAASLAEIAALRFRANAYRTAGTVAAVLAGVAVIAALLPLAGRLRTTRVRTPGRASDREVLTWAASRLDALVGSAAGGWTPESLREAHATARLVGGAVIGTGVRQQRLKPGDAVPDGRVVLERRMGRVRAALTASTTAGDIARAIDAPGPEAPDRGTLERLRDALSVIARAQYARSEGDRSHDVDDAVRAVRDIGRETARQRLLAWRPWRRPAPAGQAPVEF
ncbi:MAG: hypothetical protein U0P30_02260 [Vicinamibacterales bacterium]